MDIFNEIFFLGAGTWSFFWGFMRLRRKRLIENIPTSRVRGLALGLVELIGKTEKTKPLKTPLTDTECVFYRYTVERHERRGKSSSWVTIAQGNSFYCPFWLNDGTGKILVFPQQAELLLPVDYEFKTGFGSPLPLNLVEFMKTQDLHYKGIFDRHTLRFREWYIEPEQTVYVLGTAEKNHDYLYNHNETIAKRLEELQNNPKKMPEIDVNNDGEISVEEWNYAAAKIEQEILKDELKKGQTEEAIDVIITKGNVAKVFIISDQPQKEMLARLSWQALLGIWGGAALTVIMLWYILFRAW